MENTLPWLNEVIRKHELTAKIEGSKNRGWTMKVHKKGYDMPIVWVGGENVSECIKRGCTRLAKELDNLGGE